jgi:hypothetical protein
LNLSLADDLMILLIYSESTSNLLAVSELFANLDRHKDQIKQSMANFIEWILLNKNTTAKNSPSTELIKSISDSVMRLFTIAGEHEEVVKICLSCLISSCK